MKTNLLPDFESNFLKLLPQQEIYAITVYYIPANKIALRFHLCVLVCVSALIEYEHYITVLLHRYSIHMSISVYVSTCINSLCSCSEANLQTVVSLVPMAGKSLGIRNEAGLTT